MNRKSSVARNIALSLLPAAVLAGLSPALGAAQPPTGPQALRLTPCKVPDVEEQVRCGIFFVPEDRAKPDSRKLPLKVVLIPARTSHGRRDPIFLFEGGPGDAATESASYVRESWISSENDVVLVDQRGTGKGHRLECRLSGSDQDLQGYLEPRGDALAACAIELSRAADLTMYVTPVAMRDIDDIRRSLGYEKVNLHGGSYGARAAMVYARYYPDAVRSLYLSGVATLELKLPLYFARSAQRALDAKLAECIRSAACQKQYPDSKADLKAILQQLDKGPIAVDVAHPVTGAPVTVFLSKWGFGNGLIGDLYVAKDPSHLASILSRARSGDLKAIVEGWIKRTRTSRARAPWGMHRNIVCNEDVSQWPADPGIETRDTFLGDELVKEALRACSSWPKAALPEDYFGPYTSNLPTLITSGDFDPVTPPEWGEVARSHFPNSIHIVTQSGHSVEESGCLSQISSEFMREANVGDLDLGCVQRTDGKLSILRR